MHRNRGPEEGLWMPRPSLEAFKAGLVVALGGLGC